MTSRYPAGLQAVAHAWLNAPDTSQLQPESWWERVGGGLVGEEAAGKGDEE